MSAKAQQTVDDYLRKLDPERRAIAKELRALILKAAPQIEESIKWNQPWYAFVGNVCCIYTAGDHLNFGFLRGAELSDPQGLLEGTGKGMRHVKLRDVSDIKKVQFTKWIKEAMRLNEGEEPKGKTAAKTKAAPTDFAVAFNTLKNLLEPYASKLIVKVNTAQNYQLYSHVILRKKNVFFGGVMVNRSYVSLHFMPLYMHPTLQKTLSPKLKKRMQGKACFNFKNAEEIPTAELKKLIRAGMDGFKKDGYL
jgi:hypothetical protein